MAVSTGTGGENNEKGVGDEVTNWVDPDRPIVDPLKGAGAGRVADTADVGKPGSPAALTNEALPDDEGLGREEGSASGAIAPTLDFADRMLLLERAKDARNNAATRPPDDESISFRSLTMVEVYVGQAIDTLTAWLEHVQPSSSYDSMAHRITEARKGFLYCRGSVLLYDESATVDGHVDFLTVPMPSGCDRIFLDYCVLGPSLVALVLTFELSEREQLLLDEALRSDAESRVDRLEARRVSPKGVPAVKRELVQVSMDEVRRRCRGWMRDKAPGTLLAAALEPNLPSFALLSLKQGRPFDLATQGEFGDLIAKARERVSSPNYMKLLNLSGGFPERFQYPDCLFLVRPLGVGPDRRVTAAFNEQDALAARWLTTVNTAPFQFHEDIFAMAIADGLGAVLESYWPMLRDVRSRLERLDIIAIAGPDIISLRDRLLTISRDISTVSREVNNVADDGSVIWGEFMPLSLIRSVGLTSEPVQITEETRRRQLRAATSSLQSEEANLRELVLVATSAATEATNLALQEKVLGLTGRITTLTVVLIVLTVVLVILGVAALWVQIANTPVVHVQLTPPKTLRLAVLLRDHFCRT